MLVSQGTALVLLCVAVAIGGAGPPALVHLLPAIAAGIGGMAALTAFYRALAIGTMSIVAPISATGAAVPVIVGIASGGVPAALQMGGIVAAIVGVVLASREPEPEPESEPESETASARGAATRTSIGLALIAALGFGGFFVGLHASAKFDVLWALLAARAAGVAALVLVVSARGGVARGETAISGRTLATLVIVGTLDLSANGLYALASRHGLLSVVAVGASLYPLATVVLARLLLGERVERIQEAGIAAALVGVALIAAG